MSSLSPTVYMHINRHEVPGVKSLVTITETEKLPGSEIDLLENIPGDEELSKLYPKNGLILIGSYSTFCSLKIRVKGLYDEMLANQVMVNKEIALIDSLPIISITERVFSKPNQIIIDPKRAYKFCSILTNSEYTKYLKNEYKIFDGTHVLDEETFPVVQKIVNLAKESPFVDLDQLYHEERFKEIIFTNNKFRDSFFHYV